MNTIELIRELLESIDSFGNKDIVLYDKTTDRKFEIEEISTNKYMEVTIVYKSKEE